MSLVAGTLALTLPMLVFTFTHLGVFDFGRWQAWGWVLLFMASPLAFGSVLWNRRGTGGAADPRPAVWGRIVAGILAIGYLALAVALWIDPAGLGGALFPFDLPAFGGRVLGSWVSFLAFLAGWTATHTRAEAWIAALGLTAFAAGAFFGGLRTIGDLEQSGPYLVGLGVLTIVSWLAFTETRRA